MNKFLKPKTQIVLKMLNIYKKYFTAFYFVENKTWRYLSKSY